LIDGVEVNDPSVSGREADLSALDADNIERIEILRGAQSGLYGSDAVGGVINIITRKGSGRPRLTFSAEGGSFGTFKESAALRGSEGAADYSVSVTRMDSRGISAASEADGNTEKDGHDYTAVSTRLGYAPSTASRVDLFLRYLDSETEFDAAGGPGGDDPDNVGTSERLFVRAQAQLDLADATFRQQAGVSLADHDRTSDSDWGRSTFDALWTRVDWKGDYFIAEDHVLSVGVEFEQEEAETDSLSEQDADSIGVFVQDQVVLGHGVSGVVSLRYDDHNSFGDEFTYRIAPVVRCPYTGMRLKGTYGTAFKAPSLYQLYAPATEWGNIGNPDLEPETAESWDVGIEVPLDDHRSLLELTYFGSDLEDMIDFDNGFVNRSRVRIRGIELLGRVALAGGVDVQASYTYLDAKDRDADEALIRRPEDRIAVALNAACSERARVRAEVLYVGSRSDNFYGATMFEPEAVELDAYTVVNLMGDYRVSDRVRLHARVENLFDEDYEHARGYGTPGASAYGGLTVDL
jgi:vitamin B12 transporter